MSDNKAPPRREYRTDLVKISFRSNQRLAGELKALAAERRRSLSDTVRMLLGLGLNNYENNRLEGNTTRQKAQSAASTRRAQAEAKAAQRQRRKAGDAIPAITVVLAGSDEARELCGDDE